MVDTVTRHPAELRLYLYKIHCTMLHLFDDLWLDKIIPKNNDESRAIYGNLENKINTLYWYLYKIHCSMNDANVLIFKLTTNYLLYIAISSHFESYNRT